MAWTPWLHIYGDIEIMAHSETAPIQKSIFVVRGQRVIVAADLAKIYGVETQALNQGSSATGRGFQRILYFG
jgi:hypothetical protein